MRKILSFILLTCFFLAGGIGAQEETYPIMRPDDETLKQWIEYYEAAPNAPIIPGDEAPRGKLTLLSHLQYNPLERNQGGCGNCWAWAGTGVMAIALHVQNGILDRLSLQYITSCQTQVIGKYCCDGGWLEDVSDFYNATGIAVPWANINAHWQDGDASCDTPCQSISVFPNYPIDYANTLKIETTGVGQNTAIANIKNVLEQEKAIWFAFFLPTQDDWSDFGTFWGQDESTVWNPDSICGKTYDSGGGGHAVLCVGYNDEDPNNPYWIMLNSWGTSGGQRPSGLFRLDMDMNYDCVLKLSSEDMVAFYWQTLDIAYTLATPTPTPIYGPGDSCDTAIDATAGGTFSGSTTNLHNVYNPVYAQDWPYSWGMDGSDYVFSIDVTDPMGQANMGARVTSAGFDHALFAVLDCSDPGGSLIALADESEDNTGEETTWSVEEPGTIYLMVDSYHPDLGGDFTIEIYVSDTPQPTPTPTPTSTSTATPTPTPIPDLFPEEYTYNFDTDEEGWVSFSIPDSFGEPDFIITPGKIGFSAAGSTNCYGSWISPYHSFTVGEKYRARFRVMTNIQDPSMVPGFRIRVEDKNSQGISTLSVNSLGSGDFSPIATGKIYEMIYQPPAPAFDNGYCFTFDLINFGNADDAYAKIYIDMVEIKKVTVR